MDKKDFDYSDEELRRRYGPDWRKILQNQWQKEQEDELELEREDRLARAMAGIKAAVRLGQITLIDGLRLIQDLLRKEHENGQ